MNKLKNRNGDGTLVTYQYLAEDMHTSINTVMKLAKESGALVKIGHISRVDSEKFYDYIRNTYGDGGEQNE